jgi:hypothetical protein
MNALDPEPNFSSRLHGEHLYYLGHQYCRRNYIDSFSSMLSIGKKINEITKRARRKYQKN